MDNAVGVAKKTFKAIQEDDVGILAGNLTYRFFLALFPFFIFLAALGGFITEIFSIENPTGRIMDEIGDNLPDDAASVLETQLEGVIENQNPGLLSIGFVGAIWAASGGIRAMMMAMNRAYGAEEDRPFLKKYLVSIGLTLLAGTFILAAFALMLAGQVAGREIAEAIGLGSLAEVGLRIAQWAAVIVLLLAALAFLYWAAPNLRLRFKWVSPGAVAFVIVWIAATVGLGFYVANFGSYNETYGTLGGLVILLLWVYLTSYILLAGAELNAVLYKQEQPEEFEERRQEAGANEGVPQAARQKAAEARARLSASSKDGQETREAAAATGEKRGRAKTGEGRTSGPPGKTQRLLGAAVAGALLWLAVSGLKSRDRGREPSGREEITRTRSEEERQHVRA